MIKCPQCSGIQIKRSHRQGITDRLFACAGSWPYRCRECGLRFRLPLRDYSHPKASRKPAKNAAPEMAYRKHPDRPLAKLVIEADSHEQLDQILLALRWAVRQSNHASSVKDTEFAGRRS